MGNGAGSGIGPWLGGGLFDIFGNYRLAFWVAIVLSIISVVLIWLAAPRRTRPTIFS